jgi:hypothetical protein
MWERELLVHAMEKPLVTPLYHLLLQTNATFLVVSDGGAANDYGQEVLWANIPRARTRAYIQQRNSWTNQHLIYSLIMFGPLRSNSFKTGYQSAFENTDASTTDICLKPHSVGKSVRAKQRQLRQV